MFSKLYTYLKNLFVVDENSLKRLRIKLILEKDFKQSSFRLSEHSFNLYYCDIERLLNATEKLKLAPTVASLRVGMDGPQKYSLGDMFNGLLEGERKQLVEKVLNNYLEIDGVIKKHPHLKRYVTFITKDYEGILEALERL